MLKDIATPFDREAFAERMRQERQKKHEKRIQEAQRILSLMLEMYPHLGLHVGELEFSTTGNHEHVRACNQLLRQYFELRTPGASSEVLTLEVLKAVNVFYLAGLVDHNTYLSLLGDYFELVLAKQKVVEKEKGKNGRTNW